MSNHFDNAVWLSELHLQCIGEELAWAVREGELSDSERVEMTEKLARARVLFRTIRAENDEIALATGVSRQNVRIFRQVRIG